MSGFPAPAAITPRHHRRAPFPPAGPRGRRDTRRPLPWRRRGTMRGPVWPRSRPTSFVGGGGPGWEEMQGPTAAPTQADGGGGNSRSPSREARPRLRAKRPLWSALFPEGSILQPSSGPRDAAGLQASGNPPPARAAAREQSQGQRVRAGSGSCGARTSPAASTSLRGGSQPSPPRGRPQTARSLAPARVPCS